MSIPAVFISYSHLDEPWKDRLVKHLGVAEKQGLLRTWNDRDILGGDDWFAEIINAIERGSVAVLLVSHNSLTSGFILNEEAPRMLARHKVQAARFYPIVVEYCDWEAVEWLKRFNLRPRDARPVGINKQGERTEEQINLDLTEIAKEIRLAPPLPAASPAPEPLIGECPYLGLEAFTEDKEHLFFGRADFADALFAKVKRQILRRPGRSIPAVAARRAKVGDDPLSSARRPVPEPGCRVRLALAAAGQLRRQYKRGEEVGGRVERRTRSD